MFWGVLGYPGVSWGNQTDPKETAPWELFLSISSSTSQLQNAESVTKDLEHIISIRLHKSGWMKVI